MRDETPISQIIASEMCNCAHVQEAIESHLQEYQASNTSRQTRCLKSFCLNETSIYTKPTSVITSALSRYQKPPNKDVQDHLVSHLQEEEDVLRRRDPSFSIASVKTPLYESNRSDGLHETGTVEGSVIARIIVSLRHTEPFLMEHVTKLELLRDSESWTLNTLINAIRSYERKMNESFHTDVASTDTAVLNHYKVKYLSGDEHGAVHDYDFLIQHASLPSTHLSLLTLHNHRIKRQNRILPTLTNSKFQLKFRPLRLCILLIGFRLQRKAYKSCVNLLPPLVRHQIRHRPMSLKDLVGARLFRKS